MRVEAIFAITAFIKWHEKRLFANRVHHKRRANQMANAPALFVRWLVIGSRARRNIPANLIFLSIHTSFYASVYNSQWRMQGRGPGGPAPLISWSGWLGPPSYPRRSGSGTDSGPLRHDYLIKYAYFDKILFRTVCFYQWSWKLN